MSDIDLSFITVNYRTPDLVNLLISSIKENPPHYSYEIIAVDNDSGDDSIRLISQAHPDVRLIANSRNTGFGAGNNLAAREASGRILVIINSDCQIDMESFSNAVAYLDQHENIGILGLKVIRPDGVTEQTARGFPDPSTGLFGRSTFLGKIAQRTKLGKSGIAKKNLLVDPGKKEPYEVDWVAGTAMLIRRECWDKLGGFDEDYFMYWEDADICYRAKNEGYISVYYPKASVTHRPGSSAEKSRIPTIRYFHASAYTYVAKNISPGPSFLRFFAWCALRLRATILIARARIAG
ncbi:MAG TPA: glycosyltransferase family 2 protein [bacterium]|jgi:hypothetical protein